MRHIDQKIIDNDSRLRDQPSTESKAAIILAVLLMATILLQLFGVLSF